MQALPELSSQDFTLSRDQGLGRALRREAEITVIAHREAWAPGEGRFPGGKSSQLISTQWDFRPRRRVGWARTGSKEKEGMMQNSDMGGASGNCGNSTRATASARLGAVCSRLLIPIARSRSAELLCPEVFSPLGSGQAEPGKRGGWRWAAN